MTGKKTNYRGRASRMARAFCKGEVAFEEFMEQFGDSKDPEVSRLVDWIENGPRRGTLFGVSERTYSYYQSGIDRLIVKLET